MILFLKLSFKLSNESIYFMSSYFIVIQIKFRKLILSILQIIFNKKRRITATGLGMEAET